MNYIYWVLVILLLIVLADLLFFIGLFQSERIKAEWWEERWKEERIRNGSHE